MIYFSQYLTASDIFAMINRQTNYYHLLKLIASLVVMATCLLSISRGMFLHLIADDVLLKQHSDDIFQAFFVGARYDLKVTAIGFAPIFLSGLITAQFQKVFGVWRKWAPYYSLVISFLITVFSVGNYYYYVTYGNYIDLFAFGIFDDDTSAILGDAWRSYPIVWSFLGSIAIACFFMWVHRKLDYKLISGSSSRKPKVWQTTVVVISVVAVYFVAARGSIGSLPLKRYHANVSQYKALNIVTPNAFMAMDWARSDYKGQSKIEPVDKSELEQQMLQVLGQTTPHYPLPINHYLEKNQPHVVMALMESMGTNVLLEDDQGRNDMLGALRPHFENDFVFERFVSGGSGTLESIMMMLFYSPIPTIAHNNYQKVALESSAVLPYKEAGYEVIFLTGGNGMWRNLSNYLPVQGFDKVLDENDIKKAIPDAASQASTWGVPDEYTFQYAEELLKNATQPTMLYILTVTNHPPYKAPSDYKASSITVSDRLDELMGPLAKDAGAMLKTYQYANDSLGRFISSIKHSSLGQKTLIAATGDHRARSIATTRKDEIAVSEGVPFYMYVPQKILDQVEYDYDPQRVGSHKDVFPTLYHYSLSGREYVSLAGNNMLSSLDINEFGYNQSRTITPNGVFLNDDPTLVFPWRNGAKNELSGKENTDSSIIGYKVLLDLYLRSLVVK
ncbi:alkaline phosphatase family protein [Vibrio splendidus]|uniref:LTA synthase family protein n=1 Tax=Vibrio splendidus TaxID=29497 RepID=UPI000C823578